MVRNRTNGEGMAQLALGDLCKDSITGYKGIVIARTQWLHGENNVVLQSQELHREKGTPVDAMQFNEERLELLTPNAYNEEAIAQSRAQIANRTTEGFGVAAGTSRR